ncbi:5'-methylthioadenosine/S-adenosylhomocysteine nucleosidase [Polymorphospora rubra]|uniref:Nucleoside phosphorylase domain-containing protein n=1 Tax=Polymorphospora rubra TaxID=338584 RepID=A0A810N497_9ACTN|nr:5'-methylthioadenosine/S-adenosylhomocysteine nucleosidase [Polymorphospora rubra]BCJ68137.1 hypothetical protein Prubr_51580 [Polymorphospora rubra]
MTHGPGDNVGIGNFGSGNMTFNGPVTGQSFWAAPNRPAAASKVDVGVLTVLKEEMRAVVNVLRTQRDYRPRRLDAGPLAHEARLPVEAGHLRIAAIQTLDRGPRSAGLSYQTLIQEYAPPVVLLVGIAGGVGRDVRIGDVVLSDEVVYYDARREAADGVHRRGQSQTVAASLGHRLNEFFAATGDTVPASDGSTFRVHRGPIGSGDAVITDRDSEIRHWLHTYNEKVLAVETEAAGVAQAFHEEMRRDSTPRGWLTVRGISDAADAEKGHSYHELASQHAAAAMLRLLPYLLFDPPAS